MIKLFKTNKKSLIIEQLTQSGFYKEPAKRSVIFYGNSYYHFYYLAQALRKRDWDVITVSYQDPKSKNSLFYHGEDLNLFSEDKKVFKNNVDSFFEIAKKRFNLFHCANDHVMYFNPCHNEPVDPKIIEWKSLGKKIANTFSGCNSLIRKSIIIDWSEKFSGDISICEKCCNQNKQGLCTDANTITWNMMLEKFCDVIFGENLPLLDFATRSNVLLLPTTMCLDPIVWNVDLEIPSEHIISRSSSDEILIYHAVGNYDTRTINQTNPKGTNVIIEAVNKLKDEGYKVKLIFFKDKTNKEVRFAQAQSDIIVDQLYIGMYGATSREGMMLGKPVICYINTDNMDSNIAAKELPLISASEKTLYEVLKDLVENQEKRKQIGTNSRNYALKWLSSDACAHRYEKIYDHLMLHGSISKDNYPENWNYYDPVRYSACY